jgi:hypothetical protein
MLEDVHFSIKGIRKIKLNIAILPKGYILA